MAEDNSSVEDIDDDTLFTFMVFLNERDKQLREKIFKIVKFYKTLNTYLNGNMELVGSASEGAMISRMFSASQDNNCSKYTFNKEVEIDLELLMATVTVKNACVIEPVFAKPNHVRIKLDETFNLEKLFEISSLYAQWICRHDLKKLVRSLDKDGIRLVDHKGYCLPYFFKALYQEKNSSVKRKSKNMKSACLLLAALMNIDVRRIAMIRVGNEIKKASLENMFSLFIDGEFLFTTSIDHVGCLKLDWWPSTATEWLIRKRKWPSHDLIKELSKCCYIIAKPSNIERYNKESTEWCYSFAKIERELVKHRSENQNLIYFIAKSVFYKYLKPFNPDVVTSYLLKCTMFWICEEHRPNEVLWKESFPSIVEAVGFILEQLKDALNKNILKHYFLPEVNVLSSLPDPLRLLLIAQLTIIIDDVRAYIPYDFNIISLTNLIIDF